MKAGFATSCKKGSNLCLNANSGFVGKKRLLECYVPQVKYIVCCCCLLGYWFWKAEKVLCVLVTDGAQLI